MPCNLAVSITKAAVSERALLEVLTPEAIEAAVRAYFLSQGLTDATNWPEANQFRLNIGSYAKSVVGTVNLKGQELSIQINNGVVTVTPPSRSASALRAAQALSDALSEIVAGTADVLFGQKIAGILSALGQVQSESVTVDDEGRTKVATRIQMQLQF